MAMRSVADPRKNRTVMAAFGADLDYVLRCYRGK